MRKFTETSRTSRLFRGEKSRIAPERRFEVRLSTLRLVQLSISCGITPEIRLKGRDRVESFEREEIAGEMEPERFAFSKVMPVTSPESGWHVTPWKVKGESEGFHERRTS